MKKLADLKRSTLATMATNSKQHKHLISMLSGFGMAVLLLANSGCALQDKLLDTRGNRAFQDLVETRYRQSHPITQARDLESLIHRDAGFVQEVTQVVAKEPTAAPQSKSIVRAQSPDGGYAYPDGSAQQGITPSFTVPPESVGSPNEPQVGQNYFDNYADLDVFVGETQTGSVNIGGAYNSDNGIVGQFVIDERNFDITAFPRSFREIMDGTAFRGGGQAFRLELVPGREVQRYLVSLSEPYLFGTNYSLSLSGYLFDRRYFDWDEQRLGGRVSIGRRLTPDLSFNVGLRMERVKLDNARSNLSPTLNASIGESDLYLFNVGLVRDTRDHPFLATEGSYLAATYTQGFGDFDYPRGDIEYRRYRLMYERPDGSGRHTVSYRTKVGFSGAATPIYENYFAGGFSTLRGYDFRGAAPSENGVRIGGEFQWLNTVEYMFPVTADDMIKGVAFVDFGTVEEDISLNADNFRVAPGIGLRVHVPALGGGAPLAFDFAFPVNSADGDEEQVFSFYISANQ